MHVAVPREDVEMSLGLGFRLWQSSHCWNCMLASLDGAGPSTTVAAFLLTLCTVAKTLHCIIQAHLNIDEGTHETTIQSGKLIPILIITLATKIHNSSANACCKP